MPRWLAVGLGCLTALGMQTVFAALFARSAIGSGPAAAIAASFLALALGGYVTAHFVAQGRVAVAYGACVAIAYILLTATVQATRDAIVAHESGFAALPPLDLIELAFNDVVAMTGATCGAWLAGRSG